MTKDEIEQYLSQAVREINTGDSRALVARLPSEKPPVDYRHLTDTRGRVSTLLEYALGYELNQLAREDGYWVSNVLWNRFPDLLVRQQNGVKSAGLEIKALHVDAEEKSANLSTPISLIEKDKDFIVVMIWGWVRESLEDVDIVIPYIHRAEIFDAWQLAKMRDYGWLNSIRQRSKLIDIECPMIQKTDNTQFKPEEGNLGKLMRLSPTNDLPENIPGFMELNETIKEYQEFISRTHDLCVTEIFREIAILISGGDEGLTLSNGVSENAQCREVGRFDDGTNKIRFLYGRQPSNYLGASEIPNTESIFHLSVKLEWTIFKYDNSQKKWSSIKNGQKPGVSYEAILEALTAT